MKTLDAALQKVLTLCACYYLAVFCIAGLLRMSFPGAFEWLESNMYYQMLRVLAGQSLYVAPSLEYVPSLYPPLYFYASAAVAGITGPEFLPLRLVSYVSSLGSMALIGYLVYIVARNRYAGLWAAGLFAATYHLSATYFDAARVDPLFLFLCLGSVTALRATTGMRGCILGALLLAGAALTKQTALLLSLPMLAYVFLYRSRFQAYCFTGFFITGLGLPSLLINTATSDWYFFYTLDLPGQHPILWHRLYSFWVEQIIKPLPVAACMALCSFWLISSKQSPLLYTLIFFTMLACSCLPWIKVGGYKNVLLPAHAALALGAGIVLAAPYTGLTRRLLYIAACIQFALLWYNPLLIVPGDGNAKTVHETVAAIKKIDGEVLAPASGYLTVKAGKTPTAHMGCIDDIIYAGPGPVRDRLIVEIATAIREKRYAAILLDRKFSFFQQEVEANYTLYQQYGAHPSLWPLVKFWYVPRPQPATTAPTQSPDR